MRKGGERNENITIVAAFSVTGTMVSSPITICKGIRLNEDLTNGAHEDAVFAISLKILMDSDIFYTWVQDMSAKFLLGVLSSYC
jgi:hypothetical protein